MTKKKVLTVLAMTAPMLAIGAISAMAAASGVAPVDTAINTTGRVVQAAGWGAGAVGTLGVLHHIRSGSWMGTLEHLGISFGGATVAMNYPAIAPVFGGTAAALVHIASHPAIPQMIHVTTRLLS